MSDFSLTPGQRKTFGYTLRVFSSLLLGMSLALKSIADFFDPKRKDDPMPSTADQLKAAFPVIEKLITDRDAFIASQAKALAAAQQQAQTQQARADDLQKQVDAFGAAADGYVALADANAQPATLSPTTPVDPTTAAPAQAAGTMFDVPVPDATAATATAAQ